MTTAHTVLDSLDASGSGARAPGFWLVGMFAMGALVGTLSFAGCDSGARTGGATGGAGGGAGTGGTAVTPTPVVPPEGQFVWTVNGVTVTTHDSYVRDSSSLEAVGYRFSSTNLVIDALNDQSQICTVLGKFAAATLPAIGRYPLGREQGTFSLSCSDPTSSPSGASIQGTEGEFVITKADPGDLEGTFTISGPELPFVGGFNVGCIYPDCKSPR